MTPPAPAADPDGLRAQLEPPAFETWRTIPWQISLLEASRAAAAQERPILMIVWSGHPLGGT